MCDVSKKDPLEGYSDDEKTLFHTERYKIYNGTIAVCIIYSVLALFLILIGYFTVWGRDFILGTILPFVVTYIIGKIIIIIILASSVSNYKPQHIDNRVNYDNELCPDYWKLVKVPEEDYKGKFSSNVNENYFSYKCVMDNTILKSKDIYEKDPIKYDLYTNGDNVNSEQSSNIMVNILPATYIPTELNENQRKNFREYGLYMNNFELGPKTTDANGQATDATYFKNGLNDLNPVGKKVYLYSLPEADPQTPLAAAEKSAANVTTYPLACDKVYPLYLSAMDSKNSEENTNEPKNRYRCAYAKTCGIPWTDIGCE